MALIFKITGGGEIMPLMLETRLREVSRSIVPDVSLSLNVSIILLEIYVIPHLYIYIYIYIILVQIDMVILY
jgi:hypothetical protein